MEIIIGMTAINRPELHSNNMGDWYNWIKSLDKAKYNINWFINVDYIEKLESSVEDTIENFREIIQENQTYFYKNDAEGGNFLKACKRVSSNIEEFIKKNEFNEEKIAIIWLEDDWKLNAHNIPLQELLETYLGNMTYINLSFIRANYIHALAPSIIRWNLWKDLHLKAWKDQETHIDPEHCVGLHFIKNFGKYDNIQNITIINKNIQESYFNQIFICGEKCYNTYYNEKYLILKNDKHIEKNEVLQFCENKVTFLRITPSFCSDCGRNFMEKNNIKKTGIQNESQTQYYS